MLASHVREGNLVCTEFLIQSAGYFSASPKGGRRPENKVISHYITSASPHNGIVEALKILVFCPPTVQLIFNLDGIDCSAVGSFHSQA